MGLARACGMQRRNKKLLHRLRKVIASRVRAGCDMSDTGGVDAVRDYALSLHTKYGTDPTWGD